MKVAVDSSVLVALINPRDLWRDQAVALRDDLLASGAELFLIALPPSPSAPLPGVCTKDGIPWLRRLARSEDVAS